MHPRTSHRFQFTRGLARANYDYITLRPTVPTVELLNFVPEAAELDLQVRYGFSWWNIDANSLAVLTTLAVARDAKSIFEFGTYKGVTTRQLAESCASAEVVTLDFPPSPDAHFVPGEAFRNTAASERISQQYGDAKSFDFSPYLGRMDLVFVDAGHEYQDVRTDTENALLLARPGALVVWDDYTSWTGVRRCINELSRDLPIVHIAGTRLAVLRR